MSAIKNTCDTALQGTSPRIFLSTVDLSVTISKVVCLVPCSSTGDPTSVANTDIMITAYKGTTPLTYNSTPTVGCFNVYSVSQSPSSSIILTTPTIGSTYYQMPSINSSGGLPGCMTSDSVAVTYIIRVYSTADVSVYAEISKTVTYTKVKSGSGTNGTNGSPGIDAASISLTNYAITVPADSAGNVSSGSFSACVTTVLVFEGSLDTSASWSYSYSVTGGLTYTTSTRTFTVTGMSVSANIGSLTITASKSGRPNLIASYVVTKAIAGTAGLNATSYWMVASAASINQNIALSYNPTSINLTGYSATSGSAPASYAGIFKIYDNGSGTPSYISSSAESSHTSSPSTTSASSIRADFYLADGTTLVDTIYIPITKDGATGSTGSAGSNGSNGTNGTNGSNGSNGSNGAEGNKSISIFAYLWSNVGTPTIPSTPMTYIWSGTGHGPNTYPTSSGITPTGTWSATAGANTTAGYTLYTAVLTLVDLVSQNTSTGNWQTASVSSIGYNVNGSIGPQGNSYKVAYQVNNTGTPSTPIGTSLGNTAPSGWSFTATGTISAGYAMYRTDGILTTSTGDITWGVPYLANLKVGQLSALSADLGTITAGSISGTDISGTGNLTMSGHATFDGANVSVGGAGTTGLRVNYTNASQTGIEAHSATAGYSGLFGLNTAAGSSSAAMLSQPMGTSGYANNDYGVGVAGGSNIFIYGTPTYDVPSTGVGVLGANGSGGYSFLGLGDAAINGAMKITGTLSVSMDNTTGGGIILSDDGDIVDKNDGYCSMRFSNGVSFYSANKGGTSVATISNAGVITGTSFAGSVSGSSYGSIKVSGTAGGYGGIYLSSCSGTVTGMYDTSGNGGAWDPSTGWQYYWNRGNTCLGLGTSATAAGYRAYTGGSHYVGGAIYATGDITAYSDIRVKKDLVKIDNALDKMLTLNGYTYTRTDDENAGERQAGIIAQDLQKVLPEAVKANAEGMLAVSANAEFGLTVEAFKEIFEYVKTLEARIKTLEAR